MNPLENIDELKQALQAQTNGLIVIKPKVIFEVIEKNFENIPTYTLPIPSSDIGSVTTLEASLICSLLKLTTPKRIFEFGTYRGYTTATLFYNSNGDSVLYSIDLPTVEESIVSKKIDIDWAKIKSNDAYNDNYLTNQVSIKGETYLKNISEHPRLKLIKQNSLDLEIDNDDFRENVDFIFLDGGHTDLIVRSDTLKASQMLSSGGVLIWHDYNSNIHQKVTETVNDYAKNCLVISIFNSMLAFTSKDIKRLLRF